METAARHAVPGECTSEQRSPGPTLAGIDIVVVCTGNICRSPMGEVILRARLAERGVDAHIHSAGTLAWGGPATGNATLAVAELGLDLDGHLSRPLTAADVAAADLVLGMTRDHVWRATTLDAEVATRAFLVGELARLGASVGPRASDEAVLTWAAPVAARRPDGPIGRFGDEVADPVGEPMTVYRATAARLDRDLQVIAELLAP